MHPLPPDVFERFVNRRKRNLERIARHTRAEQSFGDVVNEAWLMALSMQSPDGGPMDLADTACQEKLLAHLYQHLVHYTEKNVRHAIRLDHAPREGGDDDVHPLTYLLVSDEGRDPLNTLLDKEATVVTDRDIDGQGSLAAAYVQLLRHFNNKMYAVADYLLISNSYAYRCCAQARRRATHLHISIPLPNANTLPGPWRRFRLFRPPIQLIFDFDDELPF